MVGGNGVRESGWRQSSGDGWRVKTVGRKSARWIDGKFFGAKRMIREIRGEDYGVGAVWNGW